MKVQCTINEQLKDGWYHADPITNNNFNGDYMSLSSVFSDGECTYFYGPELLDYIAFESMQNLINMFRAKLRKNGKILLGGTEPYLLSKKLVNRDINVEQFNNKIFKRDGQVRNLVPMAYLKALLNENGFTIVDINISELGFDYTIECIKK